MNEHHVVSILSLALASAFSVTVHAHHSVAANYHRDQTIELTGAVLDVKLQSPHSLVQIEVRGDDGTLEQWDIETNALPTLKRSGWDEDTVKAGDVLRVVAHPNRRADRRLLVYSTEFHTQDGKVLGDRAPLPEPDAESLSSDGVERIAGRWYPGGRSRPTGDGPPLPLTPAALNVWQSYDARLSPAKLCTPNNIPTILVARYLFDVRLTPDDIVLHNQVFDVIRTVPLGSEPRQVEESGAFGRASARIEGDTLVIESSDYPPSKWGLGMADLDGGAGDIPSSAQKKVIERYSVSDDGKTLRIDYTLEDPVFLTEPHAGWVEFNRVADDTPMHAYNCEVESASRYDQD